MKEGSHFNRRYFLTSTALAAAGTLASSSRRAWGAQPKNVSEIRGIELAIATICCDGFANRHHEPSFKLIPQTGFRNVEFNLWYPDTITPQYLESLKERCNQTGLTPVSLQGSGFGGEGNAGIIKDISHKLTLMHGCQQLGCRRVKFTGARRWTQGGLKSVVAVLRELAPAAESMGMLILLENHANNALERIEDYETTSA